MKTKLLLAGLLSLVTSLALAQQASTPAAPALTARHFARLPTYDRAELSPDGKHLAMTARVDGAVMLGVLRLSDLQTVSTLSFARGRSTIGDFTWSAGNRLLIELGEDYGSLAQPQLTGELASMDLDGSNKTLLFSNRLGKWFSTGTHITSRRTPPGSAYIEDALVDDAGFALIRLQLVDSDFAALYRLDEKNGDTRKIAAAPMRYPWRYFADRAGNPLLVWGANDDNDAPVIFHRESDRWTPLVLPGVRVRPELVSGDGRQAWFRAEAADGRTCLVEWDSSRPAAPARERLCRPTNVLGAVLADADRRPIAVGIGDRGEIAVLDGAAIEVQVLQSLQRQFPGQMVQLASTSRDHRVLLYRVYGDRNSGEFYVYDVATGKARFLDATQSWLDPDRMAEQRRVEFKARDGLPLSGFLTLPPGKGDRKLPLVVVPHGGPIGIRDWWGWDADAQYLASRGYAVLQVNFRGSGGYGEAFRKAGYREWGGKMIDDITDSTRALIADGTVDGSRVCIYGGSYGGYAALMSAIREPDLYRCAVGYAGVSDLPLLFSESDATRLRIGRRFWEDSIGNDPDLLRTQSPVNRLETLRAPVMIVHGEEDLRAPYGQAKALRAALERRKLPYEWLVKANEAHGFYDEANRTELFEKVGAFIDRHIGSVRKPPG